MERLDLYDPDTYRAVQARIRRLGGDTRPGWGVMTAAQMCAHCAEVLEVAQGKALTGTPWLVRLLGGLIKRMVLSGKPFPRSSKRHPQCVIVDDVEFEPERDRLLAAVDAMCSAGRESGARHPLFGPMTAAEKGWSMYKHLDHHLPQFGV